MQIVLRRDFTYHDILPVPHIKKELSTSVIFDGVDCCARASTVAECSHAALTSLGSANRKPLNSVGDG